MQLNILTIYIIGIIVALLSLYLLGIGFVQFSKKHSYGWLSLGMLDTIIFSLSLLTLGTIFQKAFDNGATSERYVTMSLERFNQAANHSLKRKMPHKNQKDILVVLYRFDCPDCEKVQKQIERDFPRNNQKIYYVPSRTKYGKNLAKRSGAKIVPSIVYIDQKGHTQVSNLIGSTSIEDEHAKPQYLKRTVKYYRNLINLK